MRRLERRGKHLRDRTVEIVVELANGVGGYRAGDLAGRMAAHAVGDQRDAAAGVRDHLVVRHHPSDRIFVGAADLADIRTHGADDLHPGRRLNHIRTIHRE